jgi:hypothetical protein
MLVQEALRDVVRRILAQVAEHGLPGEHHFFIGLRTDHPGVEMPRDVRQRYPEEMTVVLQNQFWDLEVDEEAFAVSLNFNARRQRLRVPFAALVAFADPSAEFGLRFDGGGAAGEPEEEAAEGEAAAPAGPAEPPGPSGKSGEVVPFRRR